MVLTAAESIGYSLFIVNHSVMELVMNIEFKDAFGIETRDGRIFYSVEKNMDVLCGEGERVVQSRQTGARYIVRLTGKVVQRWGYAAQVEVFAIETVTIDGEIWGERGDKVFTAHAQSHMLNYFTN